MHPYLERDMNNSGAIPLPQNRERHLKMMNSLYHQGRISLNDLRAEMGLPPLVELYASVCYRRNKLHNQLKKCNYRIVTPKEIGAQVRELPDSWLRKLLRKIKPKWQ